MRAAYLFSLFSTKAYGLPIRVIRRRNLTIRHIYNRVRIGLVRRERTTTSGAEEVRGRVTCVSERRPARDIALRRQRGVTDLSLTSLRSIRVRVTKHVTVVVFRGMVTIRSRGVV